jgi:hypothetical protein
VQASSHQVMACTPPTPTISTGCWYRFDMVDRYADEAEAHKTTFEWLAQVHSEWQSKKK